LFAHVSDCHLYRQPRFSTAGIRARWASDSGGRREALEPLK